MTLPTVEVVEVHYWAVLMRDKDRPDGEEYPTRYATQQEAEAKAQRFVDRGLASKAEGRG